MKRIDACIAIASEKHYGRISYSRLHVLVRRIAEKVTKLYFVICRSVFGGPVRPLQKMVVTQHIEQWVAAPHRREELRMLSDRGAHEQTAIGTARDGEVLRRSIFVVVQIL